MAQTTTPSSPYRRTRLTLQAYLLIAYYTYLLNVLGPVTPFLRDELALSYTQASLHFSAYAVGVILTGVLLNRVVARVGVKPMVWGGALGMAAGAGLLIVGRQAQATVTGAFLMGLLGVYVVALMNMALAEAHPQHSAVAFAEASMLSSLFAALSPLAVGFFARTPLTWRAALVLGMLVLVPLWLLFSRDPARAEPQTGQDPDPPPLPTWPDAEAQPRPPAGFLGLPLGYWVYWLAILLAVAIEFCIIFWAADYLEQVSGLAKADAALSVSAFLGALMVGRGIVSRLLLAVRPASLLLFSLLVSAAGFLLFWQSSGPLPAVAGLIVAGLGVAGLFPIINALALAQAAGQMTLASGRLSLAVGIAILLLPLLLGRLADAFGIRAAYGLVAVLIGLAVVITEGGRKLLRQPGGQALR